MTHRTFRKAQGAGNSISRRRFLDAAGQYAALGLGLFGTAGFSSAAHAFQTASQTGETPGGAASATPLVSRISAYISGARFESLPPAAIARAKAAILDCVGVAAAGANEEAAKLAGALAREEGASPEATVFGQRFMASAAQAAFVNGVAAHAHDFDHSFVVGGQPTSPIIPAVLALGEALGATGKQALEAYVTGFDVAARIIISVQDAGAVGFHPNGISGVFGAAAAAARLLGLNQSQTVMALSITASMASGVQSNFGTMTKPLHVGMAARNGILAAKLAKSGFTANPQTLDGRNGYFDSFYRGGKPDTTVFDDLGRVFALERYGVRFKPYPCGGLTHTAIYAAIALRNERPLTIDAIERIEVEVPEETAATISFRVPRNGTEGKFSMAYLIARALRDGAITLDSFTDEAVRNKEVLALLEKVDMKADPNMVSGSDGSRPAAVTIRFKNGETLKRREQFPKGSPQLPMSPAELLEKFRACSRRILNAAATDRCIASITDLETLKSVGALTTLLRG
jgi:2-methylcitrate dehydratase PrpD